jgi:hypothetical protein
MATAQQLLNKAKSQLGVQESPANSNNVKYNTDYYGKEVSGAQYPWCAVFIRWLFAQCNASELFCGGQKVAYTPSVANYYKEHGQWHTSNPKAGDLVLYKFSGSNRICHIGILKDVNPDGTINVYEGNTGIGNDANGGQVMLRTRNTKFVVGYARPNYDKEIEKEPKPVEKKETKTINKYTKPTGIVKRDDKGESVKWVQNQLNKNGYKLTIDGDFGLASYNAVRDFQKKHKLDVDGVVGGKTIKELSK